MTAADDRALFAFADGVLADVRTNLALLAEEAPAGDERWGDAVQLGRLAAETFEAIVTLLRADQVRPAYVLIRTLIELRVRLSHRVRLGEGDGTPFVLPPGAGAYEPDEWDDDARTAIEEALEPREAAHAAAFTAMCAALERAEANDHDYRWARSTRLITSALGRGEPALLAAGPAPARLLVFEALWYVLDVMDAFALVRGWAYGAVSSRNETTRRYLALKPPERS